MRRAREPPNLTWRRRRSASGNDVMGCLMCDVSGDAFDEDLCLEDIDVEASVIPKHLLEVRENLERDTEFRLDVTVIGVRDRTAYIEVRIFAQ